MATAIQMRNKLDKVFDKKRATVLAEVITDAYSELVKTGDFNELKAIVKELAEAQNRTEIRVAELAEAQNRTEIKVAELAEDIKVLARGLDETRKELKATRGDVGGLSRSMGYAFENEAYRMLPNVLKEKYGIELKEKLIRIGIGGKEINIFGWAKKNGKDMLIVGETKLRLDDRRRGKRDAFKDLEEKVTAVREEYEGEKIIRVLITHYATKGFMSKAKERDVIVVQSFEW